MKPTLLKKSDKIATSRAQAQEALQAKGMSRSPSFIQKIGLQNQREILTESMNQQ